MGVSTSHTYVCDNPACPGDGVHAGAFSVTVPDPAQIPAGWFHLSGGVEIVGSTSIPAEALFHSLDCLKGWYALKFLPALSGG